MRLPIIELVLIGMGILVVIVPTMVSILYLKCYLKDFQKEMKEITHRLSATENAIFRRKGVPDDKIPQWRRV